MLEYDLELGFVMDLCKKMPDMETRMYYQSYKSDLFSSYNRDIAHKCILNINEAVKQTKSVQHVLTSLFQYLSQAFVQPLGSLIMEIDINWK